MKDKRQELKGGITSTRMCVGGDEWKIAVTVCIFFFFFFGCCSMRVDTRMHVAVVCDPTWSKVGVGPVKLSTGYFK